MNKAEFTTKIAEKLSTEEKTVSRRTANAFVDAFVEVTSEALASGDDVLLTGFGKFYVVEYEDKKGKNPQTGEDIIIPAHKKVAFKVGTPLRDAVK